MPMGKPLEGHTGDVQSLVFSPDGEQIISGSDDHTIRLWNAKTGEAIGAPFEGHTEPVISIAFSQDGKHFISCSSAGTILTCDIELRTATAMPIKLQARTNQKIFLISFSPLHKHLVSSSWDNPDDEEDSGDMSPDEADSDDDNELQDSVETIRLWDAETGKEFGVPLNGHTGSIESVLYFPDGTRVISCSDDSTIRIWDAEIDTHRKLQETGLHFSSDSRSHSLCNMELFYGNYNLTKSHWMNAIKIQTDGWIIGPRNRRLLWLPHTHLTNLFTPGTKHILGQIATEFDLSHFAHGPLWHQCIRESINQ